MGDWKRMKWLPAGAGALLCALGLAALIRPMAVMSPLPVLIGLCVLVLGVTEVAYRLCLRAAGEEGGPPLLQGLAALAVGVVLLLNRSVSIVFLGVVLALWLFVSAVLRGRLAVQRARAGLPWGSLAADGGLKLLLALFMLLRPVKSMSLWTQILGAAFLITGVSVILSALYFDKAFHDTDDF